MSGEILLERNDDIATVTLSNPGKLNALGLGSWKRLGKSCASSTPTSLCAAS